jgi:hydroxypyruvate reductase
VTLLISDVPGDDPSTIASGPTVPDPTTPDQARAILAHYDIAVPDRIAEHLASAAANSPPVDHPAFAAGRVEIVASPLASLKAAAADAAAAGYRPLILGDALEGEAREVGTVHAGIANSVAQHGLPVRPPAVLLSGGETTVTVRSEGRGGRNAEFLLGFALALEAQGEGSPAIHGLAGDTDGIDGSQDNAGAYAGPDTLDEARAAGIDPQAALAGNDAYGVFAAADSLIMTGPTLTNVNDFRAILIRDDQD